MEKCVKYRYGIPTKCWIITLLAHEFRQEISIGFSPDFETSILPAMSIESTVKKREIIRLFRKNQLGILKTLTIGQLHYIYFLVNSNEN
jgi:hypothetical protein